MLIPIIVPKFKRKTYKYKTKSDYITHKEIMENNGYKCVVYSEQKDFYYCVYYKKVKRISVIRRTRLRA